VCPTDDASPTTNTGTYSTGFSFYARPVFLTSSGATTTGATTIPTAFVVTSGQTVSSNPQSTATAGLATNTSSPIPPVPSLSKGAIAGIAVGAAALLVLLAAGLIFLLRRRKQKNFTQPPPTTDNAYTDMKPELAATGSVLGGGYRHPRNKQASVQEKQGGMTTQSSLAPPSELPAATGFFNTTSYQAIPATQPAELPSHAPGGGQPYTHIAGGEMDTTPQHPQYIENTGPYYPEAYVAPISADQSRSSRPAELEPSQRN
jgi:hypothetical protein